MAAKRRCNGVSGVWPNIYTVFVGSCCGRVGRSPILLGMQVKLLDLQAQYLPIRHEIRRAIDEVCDQQALILGPAVERFEKMLAEYCQCKFAVGVSSGTDALLCTLMAMGIKAGDEVICPAFTFFATAGSIARTGATPVFC